MITNSNYSILESKKQSRKQNKIVFDCINKTHEQRIQNKEEGYKENTMNSLPNINTIQYVNNNLYKSFMEE